ncbi:MAG: MBL fold metallo-hydrolase [Alphaproteobacteria bacterium]
MTEHARENELSLTRRACLSLAAAGSAAALLPWAPAARAQELQIQSTMVGDIEMTVLSDGFFTQPSVGMAPGIDAPTRNAALAAAGQTGDALDRPLNVTLLRTPDDLILIDVGSGTRFVPGAGLLAEVFEANDIDPEAITKVIFTHAHPDHLWGTINDFDEISYPNADYYISAAEWNFWMADDVFAKLPENRQGFAVGAQKNLNVIKDKINTFKPGDDIVTGIRAIDTAGHTPGHVAIEVGSSKGSVMVVGDALTHSVISFAHPDWQPASDYDQPLAAKSRKILLDRLAADKTRMVGYHLPFPGLGTVQRVNGAKATYRFEIG